MRKMKHSPVLPASATQVPPASLLAERVRDGCYADTFTTTVPQSVDLAALIEAFYTTRLFKAERLVLHLLAWRPSTDDEAHALATGARDRFAAWRVTARRSDEILLTDETGRTSSWLMVRPEPPEAGTARATTRLFFGSAIRPRRMDADGRPRLGPLFHALLGAHEFYSRRLLQAAASRLMRRPWPGA